MKKKAFFILPFVSVVAEKVAYFQDIFQSLDIQTKGFYANQGISRFDEDIDICVCTIEKVCSVLVIVLSIDRQTVY